MKTVMKRGLGVLLSMLMIVAILPQITIKAKAESGVDDFVTRCYKVALQRDPDKGGFDFWKAKITNGELVGSTVVYEFIFSKEYEGQNRSDKEFVNDLYTMFMGRAADQGGYDYWCGQMASGMTRKEVFAGFANSQEFYELCYKYGITSGFYTNDYDIGKVNNVNLFVERLYKTCLGRLGDQGGQKYWVEGMLKGELTGIGCAANYIKSSEYEALGLTDEQYVENLYIGFMGRTYDEGGKANWLGHLTNKTKTRDQVFEGFANSPEFQGICAGYGIECGSYTATEKAISKDLLVGDKVVFGNYDGEPIEWDVLDVESNRVLLISHEILDQHAYDQTGKDYYNLVDTNWEQSEIRRYLNNDMYNQMFTEEEKSRILTTNISNPSSNEFYKKYYSRLYWRMYYENTNPCGNTNDKLFLLSWEELIKYYGEPTFAHWDGYGDDYAYLPNAETEKEWRDSWMLRSSGLEGSDATTVTDGFIWSTSVSYIFEGVRPVMYVEF